MIATARFNYLCLLVAEIWLAVTIPLGIVVRPTIHDFGQFYIGGAIVRSGSWVALYPVPARGSKDNAGLRYHSFAKPGWLELSAAKGVPDYTHFILPPPSALLFYPFSFLSYAQAFWLWTFILTACVVGLCQISGEILFRIMGQRTRLEGLLALLIAFSPMTARSIRIANVSPLIAFSFGYCTLALIRNRPFRGAMALFCGSMLKYATLAIFPLLVSMRRWKTLFLTALLWALAISITLLIAGKRPFLEFYEWIVPTLSRPSAYPGNQSLAGFLARIFGRPLPLRISLLLDIARLVSLGAVLAVLPWTHRSQWWTPLRIASAVGALVSWLLIFSPITWEHWPLFLSPLWGWLLWEAKFSGVRRAIVPVSLILMYFPAGILQVPGIARYRVVFPEPWNSTQLMGLLLVFSIAFARLWSARILSEPASLQEVSEPRNLNHDEQKEVA